MKVFRNSFLICCAVMLLGSCRRDDNETLPSNNAIVKGGLAFIIKDESGTRVGGTSVGITLRQEDLATNSYIDTRISDSNGRADFGQLQPDNYYYEADVIINNKALHAEGMTVVQSGANLELEVILH